MQKTKEAFLNDLQAIYLELQDRQAELNGYYDLLDESKTHPRAEEVVEAFLKLLDLPRDKDSEMAALTRIVNLREDALEQVLQKQGLSEEEIRVKKELAYGFVSMLHITRHEDLIAWIEKRQLLTPFYRALIFGVHYVGLRLSEWQSKWSDHILNRINPTLSELFNGDDAKLFEALQAHELIDRDEEGNIGDRCYSVLVCDNEQLVTSNEQPKEGLKGFKAIPYAEAFKEEVAAVATALEQLIALLQQHDDEVFDQKHEWIAYFTALQEAFTHTKRHELIGKWAEVDRRWMAITTPLQVGHPLEYYEDHYRKAVALEWDLRIVNPRLQEASHTKERIKKAAYALAKKIGGDAETIIAKNLLQVDNTQLYIGQPMLYYAAEFNGLFSAQVVPNDEKVSSELGKKIFAYADFVLESKKSKPPMRLSVETMGEDFVRKQRRLAEENPALWHRIYDISTIGHEFGHILWIDSDTEATMNVSGQFKNIEEFKATNGGLVAFFHDEEESLKEYLVDDLVSRAVGLMAWRKVGEVLPYYCEGIIHLELLYASQLIRFEGGRVRIDYDRYEAMKAHYLDAYEALARHYIAKADANEYLSRYAVKENGIYLPAAPAVRDFVEHYYARYQVIGRETITL